MFFIIEFFFNFIKKIKYVCRLWRKMLKCSPLIPVVASIPGNALKNFLPFISVKCNNA